MAAMDQQKLNTMCTQINNSADKYVNCVSSEVKNLLDAFNNNWVSKSSQMLASEIQECLTSLATAVTNTFSGKNTDIKNSVSNFNMIENENIVYSGFAFGRPTTSLTLNTTLPNGKVGVADGAELKAINDPMTSLITSVTDVLGDVKKAVVNSDAFSDAEQNALATAVENIKSAFVNNMNELKESLATRMSGEIDARAQLDRANISNLGA